MNCRRWTLTISALLVLVAWLGFSAGTALAGEGASERSGVEADPDPQVIAREIFQDQDFWWKRIEQAPEVPTSWFGALIANLINLLRWIPSSLGEWIARLLRRLLNAGTGAASGGTFWVWLVVVFLLCWSLWKLLPVIGRWLGQSREVGAARERVVSRTLPEAQGLFDQASKAYRDGNYSEAIRLALLAVIAKLETQGLLRYDHTRTNREYERELRAQDAIATPFGEVARIYEQVWYGQWPALQLEAERAIRISGLMIQGKDAGTEQH